MNLKGDRPHALPLPADVAACLRRFGAGSSPPDSLPRLLLWKRDLCAMLGVKLRTLERMVSAGEVPAPDSRLRGRPVWRTATIERWAEAGCPSVKN